MPQCKLVMMYDLSQIAHYVLWYIYMGMLCIFLRCRILIKVLTTCFVNNGSVEWGECVATNDRVAIRFPNQALNSIPLKANPDYPPVIPLAIAVLTKSVSHKMKWMLLGYFQSREQLVANCKAMTFLVMILCSWIWYGNILISMHKSLSLNIINILVWFMQVMFIY